MALIETKTSQGVRPVPTPNDGLTVGIPYPVEFSATQVLAANDIIDLGPFPPDVTPFDVTLISEDLDSNGTPTITLSVGFLNDDKTDLDGTAMIVASTVAQAGGLVRATTQTAYLTGDEPTYRRLGIKVVAGPATSSALSKKMLVVVGVMG